MKNARSLPRGVPSVIKYGSVSFPLFATKDGRIGFRYKSGKLWEQCLRSNLTSLRADAERVAIGLLNAETAVLDMKADDRRIYVTSRDALAPLGLSVDAAARDVVEAYRIAGAVPLRDLALFYKRNFASTPIAKTVNECVDHVIAELEEGNKSSRFTRDMKSEGEKRIKPWFGSRLIIEVLPEEILAKIRVHQKERKFGWKRRNHIRSAFVYIWNRAQEMGWLPQDRDNAAIRIAPLEEPLSYSPIATYAPDEMRFYIAHIREKYLPWLLVCGFSVVRSEEVAPERNTTKDRLRWSDFHWSKKYIRIRREVSKVGRKKPEPRIVPMSDTLIAWLTPWRDAAGFVCEGEQPSKRETSRLSRLAAAKGLPYKWKNNALRHTAISVLLGRTKDRNAVAEAAGTSAGKIRKNYNEGFDDDQVAAHDAIMPDYVGSRVVLPLWKYQRAG